MDFSSVCQCAYSKPLIITARLALAGGCVLLSTPRGVIMAVRDSQVLNTHALTAVCAHTSRGAPRPRIQLCKVKPNQI